MKKRGNLLLKSKNVSMPVEYKKVVSDRLDSTAIQDNQLIVRSMHQNITPSYLKSAVSPHINTRTIEACSRLK